MNDLHRSLIQDILAERDRQNKKWGTQVHSADRWANILQEEAGEVSKAVVEENIVHQRKEIVETAAVALAMLEAMAENRYVTNY